MPIKTTLSSIHLNKKLLFLVGAPSLGSIGLLGKGLGETEYKIMVNYNGQADLLLSLQIPPDYYPYQFKKFNLYDYLTNVDKYLVSNDHVSGQKKKIKNGLQNKINQHLSKIKEFGPSLWNEDLYETGIVFRNNQFWNNKKTTLLFLEQFIADDYQDIRESYDLLPRHKKLIVTNYRAARDPYTIFSKKMFECFKTGQCTASTGNGSNDKEKKLYEKFKSYMDTYNREDANSIYRFGRFIDFWNNLVDNNKDHLTTLKFYDLIKEDNSNLFAIEQDQDKHLAKKYLHAVFTKEEICLLNKWSEGQDGSDCNENNTSNGNKWQAHYLSTNSTATKTHHPALEQQLIPGSAPLSEGSQKDIIVFLYQFAASIESYSKSADFHKHFPHDYRKEAMENALNNSFKMSQNLNDRIGKIRDYFKKIKVVDSNFDPAKGNSTNTNSKTFTVLTYPPSAFGAGEATIQSMSKFPWLYRDIGLKQPLPDDLNDQTHDDLSQETFSVDDNGWWWKIGSANLDPTNLLKFKGKADTLLILANEDDWSLLQDKTSGTLTAASALLKQPTQIDVNKIQGNEEKLRKNKGYPVSYNKYHLWNEGLRSPIALNLLLDNLVDIFQRQYDSDMSAENKTEYQNAMDWGDYWDTHFLNGTHSSAPASQK